MPQQCPSCDETVAFKLVGSLGLTDDAATGRSFPVYDFRCETCDVKFREEFRPWEFEDTVYVLEES